MPYTSLVVVTPPSAEPVSPAELHDHLSLNVALPAVEDILGRCIATARRMFEFHAGGRTVVSTTYDQFAPGWPRACRPLRLEAGGVSGVVSVAYHDGADQTQTLDDSLYGVDVSGVPALVWLKDGSAWPVLSPFRPRPVAVRFTAGWDAEAVPDDVKTGILLLAAHYYRYRGDESADVPDGFVRLANKYHTGSVFS